MKASELRIGNYVYKYNKYDLENQVGVICGPDLSFMHLIEPIPLTEEWLVKFGFKYSGDLELELPNALLLYVSKEKKMYLMAGQFAECSDTVPCEYVHQLQNLYFALTDEELKIK